MIKKASIVLLSIVLVFAFSACSDTTPEPAEKENISSQTNSEEITAENESEENTEMSSNILVVYFSCTNTTKTLAEYTADILSADVYEIIPEQPYSDDDLAYYTNGRADREQNDLSVRPAISGSVKNMDEYDTIILGYPIWHSQAPRIINTFLESYDFAGKTIIPFCTSHSSAIGSSDTDLHRLCSDSTNWIKGKRFSSDTSYRDVKEWLNSIGSLKS